MGNTCPAHLTQRVWDGYQMRCPIHRQSEQRRYNLSEKGKRRSRYSTRSHYDRVESARTLEAHVAQFDPRLQELF